MMGKISNIVRSKGDPKIISTGPSSFGSSDRMARNLGWFSLGLGTLEIFAPRRVTRTLGMEGRENLVRAYGFREVLSGMLSLSADKKLGLWSRVAGDGLDIATLMAAGANYENPKKGNVGLALLMVGGITLLDMAVAKEISSRHARTGRPRAYNDRSGFPNGIAKSRGIAARTKSALASTV